MNRDSLHIYPRVLQAKKRTIDRAIFDITGEMVYDKGKDEFIFRDTTMMKSNNEQGSEMVVSDVTGKIMSDLRTLM